jgi:tRNA uridine 5-carboxymethylaminomethyl modification enzyme
MDYFDVIVVGGGHAGIEAVISAAKMGVSTALVTLETNAIGRMSCNPAIGGSAKGHLVHEIDALGGAMGLIADRTGIQFRILNKSKGPAVWAGRCQSDRELYSDEAVRIVQSVENLTIVNELINEVVEEDRQIVGVKTLSGREIGCRALIVCSGTFLNSKMHTGLTSEKGGRFGEKSVDGLTESIVKLGFETGRLKTGTPPRLVKESLDFDKMEEQPGDDIPQPFSLRTPSEEFPYLPQVSCYLTHTNENTHKLLEKGFGNSPLFTGLIGGAGPRYCPSIEDKIVRFSDKPGHQLFIEPEGLNNDLVYLNGYSTSLPADIQLEGIRSVPGLENAEMARPGYAVEYDYFPPYQVDFTLETKNVKGLYFSGQINGTSGYEEAAGQGIIAGINAALKIQGRPEFTLQRSESYIGVLIDDLVNKSTNEPYRMFTSRAEHRLILRQDNSDRRLLKYGYEFGLISKEQYDELKEREILIANSKDLLNKIKIKPDQVNNYFEKIGTSRLEQTETLTKLTKRPEVKLKDMISESGLDEHEDIKILVTDKKALEQVEIETKYDGYISRQHEHIAKMEKLEKTNIPLNFDYHKIKQISAEGREKLSKVKPRSIGQASRISGVSPSDISILLVYLKS